MKKKFQHNLMNNNITSSDVNALIKFLKTNKKKIFTQSKMVTEFEKKWSKWLGVRYSTFVNSGSSANLLTMTITKILFGKGEVLVPALTWISDISSVIQNDLKPVFVDINPETLSMDENEIYNKVNNKTKAVFVTHAQGFNGLSSKLINFLKKKKIPLIEDVCESHGATFKKKKTWNIWTNIKFFILLCSSYFNY